MHGVIADRIERGDDAPLRIALANLERWRGLHGELAPVEVEWIGILAWPVEELVAMLRDEHGERAVRLRSSSPFSGAIDQELRLGLLREARAA